jgi:hypothetical protein
MMLLRKLLNAKKKSEFFTVGKTDKITKGNDKTVLTVDKKIEFENHFMIVNGLVLNPKMHYDFNENNFIFNENLLAGDTIRILWL